MHYEQLVSETFHFVSLFWNAKFGFMTNLLNT